MPLNAPQATRVDRSVGKHLYTVTPVPDLITLKIQGSLRRRQEGLREAQWGSEDSPVARGDIIPRD